MPHRDSKIMLLSCMPLLLFLLAACGFTGSTSGSNGSTTAANQGLVPGKTVTPVIVAAKSVRGASGSGPIVVTAPTSVPGSNPNSQQVVLNDRILVINSVRKQNSMNAASSLITLALTMKNTSKKPIKNQSTFFQLMGAEGDIFTYQYNSSDNFYNIVPARSSRSGTIVFQIPKAAVSNLRLFYRSEVVTETVLVSLKV
jgi:Telomeric repeat-binding factor 2.